MINIKKIQSSVAKKLVLIFTLTVACSSIAADIRDIDIHEGMYLQGFFSDDLVHVLRIDYSRNRVKVRMSDDGTSQWVNPSRLISKNESINNDIGRTVAAVAIFACALDPDACKNNNSTSTRRANTQQTISNTAYRFKITNQCRHPIKLAMKYLKVNGKWSTNGWWTIAGNHSTYLNFSDGSYPTSSNANFYYYAKTTDNKLTWAGDYDHTLNGVSLPMRKVVDKQGDSEWTLTCDGS